MGKAQAEQLMGRHRPDSIPCSPTALHLYKPHFITPTPLSLYYVTPIMGRTHLIPTQLMHIGLILWYPFRPSAANGPNFLVQELNGLGLSLSMHKGPAWPNIFSTKGLYKCIYFLSSMGTDLTFSLLVWICF